MKDRHTRTKQGLPPICEVIARIEKALAQETDAGEKAYLQIALDYWKTREV